MKKSNTNFTKSVDNGPNRELVRELTAQGKFKEAHEAMSKIIATDPVYQPGYLENMQASIEKKLEALNGEILELSAISNQRSSFFYNSDDKNASNNSSPKPPTP